MNGYVTTYVVYVLFLEREVVYVGQTTDYNARIKQHVYQRQWDFSRRLSVRTINEALALEGCLVRLLRPSGNKCDSPSYIKNAKHYPVVMGHHISRLRYLFRSIGCDGLLSDALTLPR